jgi:type VI secretion system secreted protein VgrG
MRADPTATLGGVLGWRSWRFMRWFGPLTMGFDDITKAAQTGQQIVQAGMDLAQRVGDLIGPRLEVAHFRFRAINGPDPDWHVRRVRLGEGISQCYELVVDIVTEDLTVATDDLLGADVGFEIERGELLRELFGVIHRVDYVGVVADKLLVRVYVAPALRLLAQQIDTRIFQDLTVLEIVEQVLKPALLVYGRSYDPAANKLAEPDQYPKRDYCVQYRESDLDFVSRLLEDEGISYYFEPDADASKEKLVLINNNNDYPEVALVGDPSVPIIPDNPETADRESLRYFEWCRPEQINQVVAWHYNWKVAAQELYPVQHLEAERKGSEPERGRVRELYLHADRRKIVDKAGDQGHDGSAIDELTPLVARRGELFERQAQRGQGQSNVTGFAAGHKFELHNHSRPELEGHTYLLTRVVHTGDCPEEERHAAGGETRYENTFECIPDTKPFRPALVTRHPRVHGPTTAIVTGPAGEEIHTDKLGRIKIKFPWDRIGPTDDTSSCWARVAQSWAGPGWGAMFIPRIGMEVVVEFLEGNPDRPLVTGCVYNAFTSTPFPLPEHKTKTTLKTQSSPDKDGFNELTFEDLAGSEQVIIHAQKDFNEKVEHNHTTLVGANQTNAVDGNQSESVGGDQSMSVSGKRSKTVTKNEDNTVDGSRTTKVKGDESLEVKGHSKLVFVTGVEEKVTADYKLEVAALYDVTVTGAQKISVIGTSDLMVTDVHSAVATNAYQVAQGEGASMVLKASKASLWGAAEFAAGAGKGGESVIVGDSGGKLGVGATAELKLVCGAASILLKADGSIAITGTTKVEISGGSGGVKLDSVGASVNGPSVKIAADGINEITGAMVKIN